MRFVLKGLVIPLFLLYFPSGCAEEGASGTTPIDCGEHGTEHDGHCHCHDGYLFANETCVAAEQVTALCEEHDEEDAEHEDAEHEHHHEACRCPDVGDCHCEHGDIVTIGVLSFCVSELHGD
jgi:hypothetical protein